MAPGASKILVYEGPNSMQGMLDTYSRIATDNLAKQISTSWGLQPGLDRPSDNPSRPRTRSSRGWRPRARPFYCAAGDSGAYDNGSSLSVDDPSSQPYVTGVGGTSLTTGSGAVYPSEKTWNGGSIRGGAGGGGISTVWPIPSWQQGVASSPRARRRCATCRTSR